MSMFYFRWWDKDSCDVDDVDNQSDLIFSLETYNSLKFGNVFLPSIDVGRVSSSWNGMKYLNVIFLSFSFWERESDFKS